MNRQEPSELGPDLFGFSYFFPQRFADISTRRVAIWTLAIPLSVLVVTSIEGTRGDPELAYILADIKRIFGISHEGETEASFSAARDIYSWTQALAVMSGVILLHAQWRRVHTTLGTLVASGALTPADDELLERRARALRWLRVDRLVEDAPCGEHVAIFVRAVNERLTAQRNRLRLLVGQLAASALLAFLLVSGQREQLFAVLMPESVHGAGDGDEWLVAAYESWWAGSEHILGYVLYFVLAMFAMFLILNYQIPGVVTTYVFVGAYLLTKPSADWLNRDGHWGWKALAQTYRTILLACLLLALTITDVLLFIGVDNFVWIVGLIAMYMLVLPLFVLTPWIAYRRSEAAIKEERYQELQMASTMVGSRFSIIRESIVGAEMDRCRRARIRPLSLRRWSLATFFTAFMIPVVLAVLQAIYSASSGS